VKVDTNLLIVEGIALYKQRWQKPFGLGEVILGLSSNLVQGRVSQINASYGLPLSALIFCLCTVINHLSVRLRMHQGGESMQMFAIALL
jgi:hypothetical protein